VRVTVYDGYSGVKNVILSYRTSADNITWSSWIDLTMNQIDAKHVGTNHTTTNSNKVCAI